MAQYPADNTFGTNDALTVAGLRQAHEAVLRTSKQLPGAQVIQDLVLASDAITPTRGIARVDTQGAAASDDLVTIQTTTLPDGALLYVMPKDNARTVVVKITGNIRLLYADATLALNNTTMVVVLQRQGSVWQEIQRFGLEDFHIIGAAGEPAFENAWAPSGLTPRFSKDSSGVVSIEGTAVKNPASTSTIFTLPSGYRITQTTYFPVCVNQVIDLVLVASSGVVAFQNITAQGGTALVYLAPILFRTS